MEQQRNPFLARALESLAGAESEFATGRYHKVANRAYFACFHAAIFALQHTGVRPQGGIWRHGFVQAQFDGLLVNRRTMYPTELRGVLTRNADLRRLADYRQEPIGRTEAERALRRTRTFVTAVRARVDEER